jgi:hypothetical protein
MAGPVHGIQADLRCRPLIQETRLAVRKLRRANGIVVAVAKLEDPGVGLVGLRKGHLVQIEAGVTKGR